MDQFEKDNIKKMMEKDKEIRNKRLESRKVRALEKSNILSKQNIDLRRKNKNQTRTIIILTVILAILTIYQVFSNEVKFILNEIFDFITGKP